jgi:hypothetical protein
VARLSIFVLYDFPPAPALLAKEQAPADLIDADGKTGHKGHYAFPERETPYSRWF